MKKLAMICGIALIGASVSAFAAKFENNTALINVHGDTMVINPQATAEGRAIIANPRVSIGAETTVQSITIECGTTTNGCGNNNTLLVNVEGDTDVIGSGTVQSITFE